MRRHRSLKAITLRPSVCGQTLVRAVVGGSAIFAKLLRLAIVMVLGIVHVAQVGATTAAPTNQPAALASSVVSYRDLPQTIGTDGVVEAVQQSTLAAQSAGQIVAVRVKVGDHVAAGAVLVRIDPRIAEQGAVVSQSQLTGGQAALASASRSFARSQQLYAQQFISKAALDQAELDLKAARANVAALQAGVGQTSTMQSFSTVLAPYAAVVSTVSIEVGDMATQGRALVGLFDPTRMRVVATISASRLPQIALDRPALVDIPGAQRALAVDKMTVLPVADSRAQTVQLRLPLRDAAELMPGQFVRVNFQTGLARKLVVRESCVLYRSEVTAVYVLMPSGFPQLRQVRVGEPIQDKDGEHYIEILAGLAAGEIVALDPIKAGLALAPGIATAH